MAKKVLCVDDANLFSELEPAFLARIDAELRFASSGAEGMTAAVETRPDLILLDFDLRDTPGDELCARFKGDPKTADVPILVVTAEARSDEIERSRAAGCDDFESKPLRPEQLLAKVAAILRIPYRYSRRVMVRLETQVIDADVVSFGTTADLSEGGMNLATAATLPTGAELRLRFLLPGEGEVEATGKVVWESPLLHGKRSFGIRFTSISDAMRERVRAFVGTHLIADVSD